MQHKNWASRVTLSFVLLFLTNLILVIAGQILLFYRYPAQPDSVALASYSTAYQNCRIITFDSVPYLNASLVETADGESHLVVTKVHYFAYHRGEILYSEKVELPASGEISVLVKTGIHTSEIRITDHHSAQPSVSILYGNVGNIREFTALLMLCAAILEALELAILYLIKRSFR